MKFSPLVLLIGFFTTFAQATDEGGPRFRTLGLGVAADDLFYELGGKDVAVTLTQDAPSGFYELPAGGNLAFYRLATNPDGGTARQPVASVKVAGAGLQFLVIVSVGGPGVLSAEVLADDLQTFPAGSYRFLNRTDAPLTCILAGTSSVIAAHSVELLKAKSGEGTRTVFLQVLAQKGKDRVVLYSNNWAWSPLIRTMIVAAPPVPPATTPSIRRIGESVEKLSPSSLSPAAKP